MSKKTPTRSRPSVPAAPAPAISEPVAVSRHTVRWPWAVLGIALLFLTWVRLRLLSLPLERDEGGFAYIGKTMFEGQNLYTDLHDSKLPGLYFVYGVFVHLFGYSAAGVHAGLLLCNAAATVLLFFLGKKLYGAGVGAWAALVFAVMSASPNVLGAAAHATQLLLPFALGGLLVLVHEVARPQLRAWAVLLAGGLLSVAFLIKQQALFFMPFAALYLWAALRERSRTPMPLAFVEASASKNDEMTKWRAFLPLLWLTLGSVLPYLAVLAYMLVVGRAEAFWFWTYELPSQLGLVQEEGKKAEVFGVVQRFVMRDQWALWGLAAVGLLAVWRSPGAFSGKIFASGLPLLALGGVLMGSVYYPHYWALMLPGLALLAALAARYWFDKPLMVNVMTGALLIALLWAVYANAAYYFSESHTKMLRRIYNENPFPECAAIGAEIKKRSRPGDEMLVFGAEPELLVSAGLPSVTGHIFPYHLLDGQWYNNQFQNELFVAVAEREPRFVAVFTGGTSWQVTDLKRGNQLMGRLGPSVFDNPKYRRIGIADIYSDTTLYKWDQQVAAFQPKSKAQVWVYENMGKRK